MALHLHAWLTFAQLHIDEEQQLRLRLPLWLSTFKLIEMILACARSRCASCRPRWRLLLLRGVAVTPALCMESEARPRPAGRARGALDEYNKGNFLDGARINRDLYKRDRSGANDGF